MAAHPSHASTADARLSPIVRQFWRLLEFTRDIDRNEDDSLFVRNGGRIAYVFDENVFEFFINPQRLSRYAALFHSNIWFDPGKSSEDLRRISAQSALVASEYLFSGELPGQENRKIYMTEWHFGELNHRRLEYTTRLRQEISELSDYDGSDTALEGDLVLDLSEVDQLTSADRDRLAKHIRDESALQRFIEARVAARQLARSDHLGSMLQLKRIGSRDIASRIVPLGALYRPTPDERESIRVQRRAILTLLGDERKRRDDFRAERRQRGERDDRTADATARSDGALQNDADSLAYICWIAQNKLGPNERIVFVTGDNLLFDAYRSWYLEQPGGAPFVLRRISQFAPIINLNDAPSDIVDRRDLFWETREAVEAALFVFNLSGSGKKADRLLNGREYLALALSRYRDPDRDPGLASFLSGLTGEWMERRASDFAKLVHLWQQLERVVIGLNSKMIMQRFSDTERTHLQAVAAAGQGAYVEYLKGLLDELVSGSIRLFFPFAVDFIRDIAARDQRGETRLSRVPIALRLTIPSPRKGVQISDEIAGHGVEFDDVHDLFIQLRDDDDNAIRMLDVDQNPTLAQRPDLVYAIAATLALETGEWRDAERFADLACSADPMIPIATVALEESRFEAIYLSAIAKRFRIGSLDPSTSGTRVNVWRTLLTAAVENLARCELHHARRDEIRRTIRAISERAAARLFYVCWAAVTPLGEARTRPFDFGDAMEQYNLALADLRKCLALEEAAQNVAPADQRRHRFIRRLERQYVTNLAAAEVIRHLLERQPGQSGVTGLTIAEIDLVLSRIARWEDHDRDDAFPAVAQADILAFKTIARGDSGDIARFIDWSKTRHRSDLAVDRAVIYAYERLIVTSPQS